jgi:hypothetical protein
LETRGETLQEAFLSLEISRLRRPQYGEHHNDRVVDVAPRDARRKSPTPTPGRGSLSRGRRVPIGSA